MESLNGKLSPIDEHNFYCSVHDNLFIGVCGNSLCKEKRLICMKCIENKETCITKESHELICLSEFFYRFFLKQENKSLDLDYLNSRIELISDIDKNEVLKGIKEFHNQTISTFNKFNNSLRAKIESELNVLKEKQEKNFSYLEKFSDDFTNNDYDNFIVSLNDLFNHPILKNNNKEESNLDTLISLFDENKIEFNLNKKEAIDFMFKIMNFNVLSEKVSQMVKYCKLEESIDNYDFQKLENKIDNNLASLEKLFDEQVSKIESKITIERESVSYMKPNQVVKFNSSPDNFVFIKDISDTAHVSNSIDSVFCAFKTLKGENLVAWGTPGLTIEILDLKQNKITKSIKSAHSQTIFSCRNYIDVVNSNDLIISSSYDKSVKVWSYKDNWSNIVNIQSASNGNYIYSACVLSDKNERKNYIINSCPCEFMEVWDFNGKHIKEFGTNTESTYFVDSWYYNKNETYYIINANSVDVKSYVFKTGLLYKTYKTSPSNWHMSAIVYQLPEVTQLIESDGSGTVRIWDFHTANLLKSISLVLGYNLRGICLWNEKYLFGAGSDCHIKMFDLKAGTFVKDFKSHTKTACSIQKIIHPQYGECLISHSLDGKLKLWAK